MNKNIMLLLILIVTTASADIGQIPVSSVVDKDALVNSADKVPVIVGFKDKVGPNEIGLLRSQGANIKRELKEINAVSARIPPQSINPLRNNPKIKYITENYKGFHNTTESLPWGVDKINAEQVHSQYRGKGVLVSIIDTGIDYNHEDLISRVVGGHDYANNDWDPMDDMGHGTHVAGIAAANDNDVGVIGVAPEVSLLAMKFLDSSGSGSFDDAAASIIDSTNAGAKIISMSWGCGGNKACDDPTVMAAIQYAYGQGVLLIAAAGNYNGGPIIWPAAYPEVIAVTATDQNDTIAYFSNVGQEAEISAPGTGIQSTVPTGSCILCNPTGYALSSGTSMATPHVSGTAALIWGAYPWLTRDQVRGRLSDYSVDLGPIGRDPQYGFGRIDANASIFEVPPPPPFYIITEPAYNWIDGVTGGKPGPTGDNVASDPISIGFDFPFYGTPYTQLWFSTNGLITFDVPGTFMNNSPIPNPSPPNNFTAPYWDNLYIDGSGATYYMLDASSSPKKFIVTWHNVSLFGGSARTTLEAVLYEDGRILYQYQQPSLFESDGATVGVEGVDSLGGQQYKYNEPIDDYSAVLFTPGGTPGNTSGDNMFVFAQGGDNALWYRTYDGASWSEWISLGGVIDSDPDAAKLNGDTYVFARGADNTVWTQNWNGTVWSGWQSLGGVVSSEISATSSGSNITIFARGEDNGVWTQNWNGTIWSGWQSLGGVVASNIASSSDTAGSITIFARSTDNGVWTQNWNGTVWSGWQGLGGIIAADPDSVSSTGMTYVFVRGADNGVWTRNWNGSAWSGWQGLGGIVASNISSSSDTGNITIFARGEDNGLWTQNWNGTVWNNWQALGGVITSDPDSISVAGKTYVFVRGADNAVWTQNWNGSAWSDWQSFGGLITGKPEVTSV